MARGSQIRVEILGALVGDLRSSNIGRDKGRQDKDIIKIFGQFYYRWSAFS